MLNDTTHIERSSERRKNRYPKTVMYGPNNIDSCEVCCRQQMYCCRAKLKCTSRDTRQKGSWEEEIHILGTPTIGVVCRGFWVLSCDGFRFLQCKSLPSSHIIEVVPKWENEVDKGSAASSVVRGHWARRHDFGSEAPGSPHSSLTRGRKKKESGRPKGVASPVMSLGSSL